MGEQFAGVAAQYLPDIVDVGGVFLLGDFPDAASGATPQVVFEAEAAFASGERGRGDGDAASADGVELMDERQHRAGGPGVGVRAEIFRAVAQPLTGHEDAWKHLLGDAYPGV